MMSEKIRKLLKKKGWSVVDLAKAEDTGSQNLYNKLSRDNFSEKELQEIADILEVKLEINFVLENGEKI